MDKTKRIFIETINKHGMMDNGDKIIVGVSGGPDSICLLHLLLSIREEYNLILCVAHINHKIRKIEGDNDEIFVKNFCKKNNIPFYSRSYDVEKIAKKNGESTETCGRNIRYEYFNELFVELKANKIALAHNLNDQAETILMRIMRGTGLDGLMGIKAVRDNVFIRPLINVKRKDIEGYLIDNNIESKLDKTNLENIYRRNKIRLELIPYIENNFNENIISSLERLRDTLEVDLKYIDNISDLKYEKYCKSKGNKIIIEKDAFLEDNAIVTRIIRKAYFNLMGTLNNLEKVHVYNIIKIQKSISGSVVEMPNGIIAKNVYNNIVMQQQEEKIKNINEYTLIKGENFIEELGYNIKMNLLDKIDKKDLIKSLEIKYFDYDKIDKDIKLRFRREGDVFHPIGMKGSKKIKKFFIDIKLEESKRDKIPLICFGDDIGWIVGIRVSEKYKIDSNTKKVLEIKFEREV
ncbi:MAG: tRNA lysidine(34) synthetase TilS [Clostridiaceae bacterium]